MALTKRQERCRDAFQRRALGWIKFIREQTPLGVTAENIRARILTGKPPSLAFVRMHMHFRGPGTWVHGPRRYAW